MKTLGMTAFLLTGSPWFSASFESVYTRLDLNACQMTGADFTGRLLDKGDPHEAMRCPGLPGYPLWITINSGRDITFGIGRYRGLQGFASRDPNWPIEWRGARERG